MAGRPPNPELRQARQGTIVETAARLFSENGVHQTTMKDIGLAAGISMGAMYHYFASKEDIVLALAAYERSQLDDLMTAIDESRDVVSTLDDWAERIVAWQTDLVTARLTVAFTAEALHHTAVADAFRETDDRLRIGFEQAFARSQQEGHVDSALDPATLALILQSVFYGISAAAAFSQPIDKKALAFHFRKTVRALCGPSP